MRTLFLTRPLRVDDRSVEGAGRCPLIIMKELGKAVLTMKNKEEAPESDGIPKEVYNLVF